MDIVIFEKLIQEMINELKGVCMQVGLSNQAAEEHCVTSILLYKFLDAKKDWLPVEYSIESMKKLTSCNTFPELFDQTLRKIADRIEEKLLIENKEDCIWDPVIVPLSKYVNPDSKDLFISNVFNIISNEKYDISDISNGEYQFDFFSVVFEYMIKDYNVATGVYAEYFTPQIISYIIGQILMSMYFRNNKKNEHSISIYDPAAGTGSLILHLDAVLKEKGIVSSIYTQDISLKSTRYLKFNLILNSLYKDELHIAQGDTLLVPVHCQPDGELRKFELITSNPPFKVDFSSTRDEIAETWKNTERFFAGIPKIPTKKKTSMPIYLMFIQHILYSLSETGKAAIVVPASFLSARTTLELTIKKKLIDENLLVGAITMPSRIFANTTTQVSVLFIDRMKKDESIFLMDASAMGEEKRIGRSRRIVLSQDESKWIINTFIKKDEVDKFTVLVNRQKIQENRYSCVPGYYFKPEFDFSKRTEKEFKNEMREHLLRLEELKLQRKQLEKEAEQIFLKMKNWYEI